MGIQIDGVNKTISSGDRIDFPSSIGVGGTLTYEDVANVDSIGIITARSGIRIGTGGTIGPSGSGIVTYFGDGSQLTGIDATQIATGNTKVQTVASRIDSKIDNVGILTVTTAGVNVTGVVTATSFVGSGANLTNLPSSTSDKIEEGDSKVEVVDTGTGKIDLKVDGSYTARFKKVNGNRTYMLVGNPQAVSNDYGINSGHLIVLANSGAEPATLRLFGWGAGSSDGTINNRIDFASHQSGSGGQTFAKIETVIRGSSDNSSDMTFHTAASATVSERLRITSGGDIGVGINAPVAQLQVNSTKNAETDRHSAANYHLALRNPADDNGESIGLSFGITSNATKVGAAILHERDGGGSQGSLQFYTSSDGNSLSERLRIDSSGRLLLGTTTEGVSTGDKFTIATSSNTGMTLRSGTSNEGNIFFSDGTSGADEYRGSIQYNHGSNFLTIGTDGVERLRINQHGTITNTTNSSHSQGAGTFNIKGIINQYSQGSGSGLIFDCDFGRLTGYADNASIANSANLSSALAHSTTDWTSSSSNTPMTVNGGSFNYRVGFGGYLDCVQNEGRVSIGAGSGVPAMSDKLNTASMTIETWIWYDGAGREVIVSRYGSGFPNQFNMLCDPNGQFHYNNTGVGAGGGNITGQHFPDKTWHHHLWQYDSGNNVNRWYINGAFANSASAGSSLAVGSSTGFAIASRADDMERWDGKIAIVRIYNRALSATEIKNHFELERGRFGV